MALTQVSGDGIKDGSITNADLDASAAIAGSKISPDFGGQNILTTGTATAGSFIPTSATVPANGVYLPAPNNVAISTNGAQALYINADGDILVADGNRMEIDEVRARDGAGLKLFDDAGGGIFVQDGGNVGIGTSSPNQLLDVAGNIRYTDKLSIDSASGNTSASNGIYANSVTVSVIDRSTSLRYYARNSELTASTITSASLDSVSSAGQPISYGGSLILKSGEARINHPFNAWSRAVAGNITFRAGTAYNSVGTSIGRHTFFAGYISFDTGTRSSATDSTYTERMRITADGNVGIGTTSPAARLSFGGNVPANGQTVHIYQAGNIRSGLGVVSGVYRVFTDSSSVLSFGQVSTSDGSTYTERARIDSSGRLLVGTSSGYEQITVAENIQSGTSGNASTNKGPKYKQYANSLGPVEVCNFTIPYITAAGRYGGGYIDISMVYATNTSNTRAAVSVAQLRVWFVRGDRAGNGFGVATWLEFIGTPRVSDTGGTTARLINIANFNTTVTGGNANTQTVSVTFTPPSPLDSLKFTHSIAEVVQFGWSSGNHITLNMPATAP